MREEQKSGKIVPFSQDHDFYYNRAIRCMDRDDIEQAAYYASRAAAMDENNAQCRLELAGLYSEMGRFARSNELLMGLIAEENEDLSECWLGAGCNFASLQYYGCARDALHHCLDLEDGDTLRAQDALDVLEPIEDYCDGDDEDRTTWYLHHRVMEARELFYDGRMQEARALFAQLDAVEPLFMDVRNFYARTLFELGKCERAIELCRWVTKRYPSDVLALCSLADFYRRTHQKDEEDAAIARILELNYERDMESTDDLVEVSRTLYRAERYDEAQTRLVSILRMDPCRREAMHLLAACAYMKEDYDEAISVWQRMTRIDPEDAVCEYYLAHTLRVKSGKSHRRRAIEADVLLPESEAMRRLVRIHKALEDIPAARQKWKNRQREFLSLIRWGCEQAGLRKTMSVFLCMMGDEHAATILRGMLLHPSADEDLKRHICAALKTMGAKEPYYLIAGDELAQVRVKRRENAGRQTTQTAAVLRIASENLPEDAPESMTQTLENMWTRFLDSQPKTPLIRSPQAYAAALEYCYWMHRGQRKSKSELIRKYGANLAAFNRALMKLSAALADEE